MFRGRTVKFANMKQYLKNKPQSTLTNITEIYYVRISNNTEPSGRFHSVTNKRKRDAIFRETVNTNDFSTPF